MKSAAEAKGRSRKRPPFARRNPPEIPNQDGVDADKGHMGPRQGNVRMRRFAAAVACALAGMGVLAPSATADEWRGPTTEGVGPNPDWTPSLAPPEKPAAVCLVDSGVNITPDTPADSPDGPILKRLSLDRGPGTA